MRLVSSSDCDVMAGLARRVFKALSIYRMNRWYRHGESRNLKIKPYQSIK